MQWWKRPGADMGRYRSQYLYRCPHHSCRGQVVEPAVLPAVAAIDWALPGTRIGDRAVPLKPKMIARIEAGLRKYAVPITLEAAGNTFERHPGVRTRPVDGPLTTQTTSQTKALACAPLIVPAGGTWREEPAPVTGPIPTRTARENDALAVPPFVTVHRGAGGDVRTAEISGALPTVAAGGNHLGLAVPPFLVPLRSGWPRAIPAPGPLATVVADGSNHGLVGPRCWSRWKAARGRMPSQPPARRAPRRPVRRPGSRSRRSSRCCAGTATLRLSPAHSRRLPRAATITP